MGLYLAIGGGVALLAITFIVLAATSDGDSAGSSGGGRRGRSGGGGTGGATYGFDGNSVEDVVAGLEAYRDRMCECTRASCVERTERDFKEWKRQARKKVDEKDLEDRNIARKIDRLDDERKKCRNELRSNDTSQFIDLYERFADRACLCTSSACATRVSDDMSREMADWAKRNTKASDVKPDYDTTKRLEQIGKRLTDCLVKAQSTLATDPTTP